MALYHVHANVISKGKAVGGSAGFAQYITREPGHAERHAAYVGRESHPSKEDLVEKGHGGLPTWARDGVHFFQMADRYSHKNATIGRVYEIALPRELQEGQRAALAADIRATFFERYPHVYAIHNPIDKQGQEHPHMHLMLSERRQIDDIERSPKVYFKYAVREGRDPAEGGVGVDRGFHGPARLREVREGIATLTNAALEREGHAVAVSHQSHRTNGFDRTAAIYRLSDTVATKAQVQAARETLHREYYPLENDANLAAWYHQRQHEEIRDLSREAMVDHVRDSFWRHDQSLAREQERLDSVDRFIHREYDRTGRVYVSHAAWQQEQGEKQVAHAWERTLQHEGMAWVQPQRRTIPEEARQRQAQPHGIDDTMTHGVHWHEEERER